MRRWHFQRIAVVTGSGFPCGVLALLVTGPGTFTGSIELGTTPQSVSGVVGTAITPTTPFGSGWTTPLFTVPEGLPDGLSMNISSGVISGTPTAEQPSSDYLVRVTGYDANKDAVSTETALSIAVTTKVPDPPAPAPQREGKAPPFRLAR